MHTAIYYFSGTGNSLRAARVIGAALGGARLISMRSDSGQAAAPGAERIGFVCPVYEWDIPKRAKAFVQGLFCGLRRLLLYGRHLCRHSWQMF